jgi:hypothetical protein
MPPVVSHAREHLNSARQLVQLQHDKLDLLQGGGGEGGDGAGAPGAAAARRAAAQSLEELKAAISNHLHVSGDTEVLLRDIYACVHACARFP